MQAHHQSLARPDSPIDNHSNQHRLPQDMYSHQNGMYSSLSDNSVNMLPDYVNEHESRNFQQQHPNAYRSNFNSYPTANTTRPRHQANRSTLNSSNPYDTSSYFATSASDVFPPPMTSPVQSHMQAYEHRPSYDFVGGPIMNGATSTLYNNPSTGMHQPHQVNGSKSQQQQPQHGAYSASYANGLHLSSQTPYGPHVPAVTTNSLTSGGVGSGGPPGLAPPNNTNPTNGSAGAANPEEISTIFVVGFPEDMQEREFQNMFTFSPGFEAATLKIPNKEYTSYGLVGASGGSAALRGSNGYTGYVGPNDPYNLVTVNQGGVVVDAGRDGTMTSWPASVPGDDIGGGHFLGGTLNGGGGPGGAALNMPPRKQIIGFAKFKTREEAVVARDVLQGRRVDIDKGAVLKAEMAKKNLHTKRGVGPVPGGGSGGGSNMSGLPHTASLNGGTQSGAGAETYGINGAVTASDTMGLMGSGRLTQWRESMQDHLHPPTNTNTVLNGNTAPGREEEERRQGMISAMGLGGLGSATRGPRERAEDDERERRRKEKEFRLRAGNSTAFDAFHSVPAVNPGPSAPSTASRHISNLSGTGLLTVDNGFSGGGTSPMMGNGYGNISTAQHSEEMVGPWDSVKSQESLRPRSSSQRSMSPSHSISTPGFFDAPSVDQQQQHLQYLEQAQHEQHQQYDQQVQDRRASVRAHAHSVSSSSSVVGGSQNGAIGREIDGTTTDEEMTRAFGALEVSTEGGKISPQLPSPASGASSRNGVDQNPPINTLYVGNLPTSPSPAGFPQDYLEESLRELFSSRVGFRRLCFRQKSNGPMCFVEFEDVPYATKALNDLYGNTLKGLVKGGIRLSYSKNPLGVRTPTSAGSNGSSMQQQQLQNNVNVNNNQLSFSSTFAPDFQPKLSEEQSRGAKTLLQQNMNITSPPPSQGHHALPPSFTLAPNYLASPPPRFYSSSPSAAATFGTSSGATTLTGTSSAFMPRSAGNISLYGFGMSSGTNTGQSSSFSPFGLSSTPPPQSIIPDHSTTSDHVSSTHS